MQSFARSSGLIQEDFKGILTSKIIIKGHGSTPENLGLKADLGIDLLNAMVNNIPIEKAYTKLDLDYQNTDLLINDAEVLYKDIKARAKGQIADIPGSKTARFDVFTDVNLEDLDKLPIPKDLKTQLDGLGLKGNIDAKIMLAGPLSSPNQMDIIADLVSKQIEVKKAVVEDVKINANLKNKILNANLNLIGYQGTASVNAKADISDMDNFSYTCLADISNVDLGQLIRESQIIAGSHQGIVSLTADLAGFGKEIKNITGKANLKINDAVITSMGMLKLFAKIFKAEFLSDFQITLGNMDLIFAEQKATLENTSFDGPDAVIKATGDVLLETLGFENFFVTLMLTDSGAGQIPGDIREGVFDYSEGYFKKTVEVKGTLTVPDVDQTKILYDIGKKQIFKQIFKTDSPSGSQQPVEKPAEQLKKKLIEGVLDGLFK
jgi:hypothetical protein